ncbi:DUF2812 domain-containing protein [Virgibacillus sp. SK37]|uniref:DUF2812 domain-containing protein n=1 Tax=Virgibacillus sp. SK37 TaxID=403957 RepID=UPI0004D0CFFC|nr:DUF2812 domain-containing protein [Virgibacillus sp. SK37]AIF42166.1 hypothetical protein X953_01650 [Virgibacillus sp. SK37]
MTDKEYKYVETHGVEIDDNGDKDMDMLSDYAKEGWILEGTHILGYRLVKTEPQNLIYSVDMEDNPNEEYFGMFEESGWKHVCSSRHMHFFSAAEGTTPIYTEEDSLIEKYKLMKGKYLKFTKRMVYFYLLTVIMALFSKIIEWFPMFIGEISLIVGTMSLMALPFTVLPYLSYRGKYKGAIKSHFNVY